MPNVSPYFVTNAEAERITGFSSSHVCKIFKEIRDKNPTLRKQKGVVSRKLFEKYLGITDTYKGEAK